MDIDPAARERLAAEMEARALDLGLNWREVAVRAGLSYEIVRRLRTSSTSVRPLTLRKVDTGLGWEPGSIERILNGGEPTALAESTAEEIRPLDEFERRVMAADLPYAEKAAAVLRHREQIREQLAELGIGPAGRLVVPPVIRDGIGRLTRGDGADDGQQHERRA